MRNTMPPTVEAQEQIPLDVLSEKLQLSKQTLVRWVDRHLVDASLGWRINAHNEEERVIEVEPDSLDTLLDFASDYRSDLVSRTEARRILKVIDRREVKRLLRADEVVSRDIDGETRILVGSIEDYLMRLEEEQGSA